jgi:hypothetical protein
VLHSDNNFDRFRRPVPSIWSFGMAKRPVFAAARESVGRLPGVSKHEKGRSERIAAALKRRPK